jgi:IS4 transposase
VQFEVLKGTASQVEITPGVAAENERLKENLQPGRLYVLDRGFRDFDLFQRIVNANSSFVVRLGSNALWDSCEEKALTPEAMGAGVTADRIVRLGWHKIRHKFDRPVRLIEVHVPERPPRGLAYPVKKVSSKKSFRQPVGAPYTLLLATDRLDLPADVIALIYLHRWKVELFFRLLKSVLGCRHLLSDSIEGVSIQVYCALIATLLLAEYTGLPASKRTFELAALYLQGWVSNEELARELGRLQREAARKKA